MKTPPDTDARLDALRDAFAKMEPPELPKDTLALVLARRQRGERLAMPIDDGATVQRDTKPAWIVATLAAAAAILLVSAVLRSHSSMSGEAPEVADQMALAPVDEACATFQATHDSSTLRHLMVSAFGVAVACGAEVAPSTPITIHPSQLTPGNYTYGGRSITDGLHTSIHKATSISISRTSWRGTSAYLIVRDGPLITRVSVDSLTVSARDLRPLHWASWYVTQKPVGIMRADFDSANVTIILTGKLDTTSTFPYPTKPGELPFGWTTSVVVPALPLAAGWHGTLRIAPPIHPRAYKLLARPWQSIELRVIGRETVQVAAGSFDCWKVQVGNADDRSFMWVGVASHLVIRTRTDSHFGDTEFDDIVELQRADYSGGGRLVR